MYEATWEEREFNSRAPQRRECEGLEERERAEDWSKKERRRLDGVLCVEWSEMKKK